MAQLSDDPQLEVLYQTAQTAVTNADSALQTLVAAVDNVAIRRTEYQTARQSAHSAITQFMRRAFGITPGAAFRQSAIRILGDEDQMFEEIKRRL